MRRLLSPNEDMIAEEGVGDNDLIVKESLSLS
jgi:hypothetical protein